MTKILVNFYAEPEDYDRWKEEAKKADVSFAEYARTRMNSAMSPVVTRSSHIVKVPSAGPVERMMPPVKKRAMSGKRCPHGVPDGSFCKRCT